MADRPPRTDVPVTAAVRFANTFLIAYALDALVSMASFWLLASPEAGAIWMIQRYLASVVMILAVICVPVLAFTARLPAPVFTGLSLSVFWLATGAAPLPLFVSAARELPGILALIQVGIAGLGFAYNRQRTGGRSWLLRDASLSGEPFSVAHTTRYAAVCLILLGPLACAYALVSVGTWLEIGTGHFVQVNVAGVQLSDRLYVRNDREIRLVAMMHLGEDETYQALARSFVSPDTIVLEEGVSDEASTLGSAISYDGVASALGLRAQRSIDEYLERDPGFPGDEPWPVLRNADVDASTFSESTIEYLGFASALWSAEAPFNAFLDVYRYGLEHPQVVRVFMNEVLNLRNQNLLKEIDQARSEFARIIVPWGALHMPEIEREVLERGYTLQDQTTRQIVGWTTLAAAIF